MKLKPTSTLGKLSILSIIFFFIFLGLFFELVYLGERGGQTFFSNLKLTIPFLLSAISGICSFIIGLTSIIKKKEKSILVFLSTLIGLFVLIYITLEFSFPH